MTNQERFRVTLLRKMLMPIHYGAAYFCSQYSCTLDTLIKWVTKVEEPPKWIVEHFLDVYGRDETQSGRK